MRERRIFCIKGRFSSAIAQQSLTTKLFFFALPTRENREVIKPFFRHFGKKLLCDGKRREKQRGMTRKIKLLENFRVTWVAGEILTKFKGRKFLNKFYKILKKFGEIEKKFYFKILNVVVCYIRRFCINLSKIHCICLFIHWLTRLYVFIYLSSHLFIHLHNHSLNVS